MKNGWVLMCVLLAVTAFVNAADPVGQWTFDNAGDLTQATVGSDLTLVGSHSATAGIDGGDGAASIGVGSYYNCSHGIAANGGGSFVNEWSLLVDFKYPILTWISFFQTSTSNSNDADCFVRGGGGVVGSLGLSATNYSTSATTAETWYRMVVTVDNGSFYRIYVNGSLWLEGIVQSVDGSYSLDSALLLFADENSEDNEVHVSEVALYDQALTAGDVAALGGPGGEAPPFEAFETSPYLQNVKQDGMTIMWELADSATCSVDYGLDTGYGSTNGTTQITSAGGTEVYTSVLTGLSAGTTYCYRVNVGGVTGEDQTFTTAPAGEIDFSFGTWGDSQGSSAATTPMIAHLGQNVDIAIAAGDMCESGTTYSSVDAYFLNRIHVNLGPASVPLYVAWGNHDGYVCKQFASHPAGDSYGNFSFDYSGCHFICIDDDTWPAGDGASVSDETWPFPQAALDWIEADLQQAVANEARAIFLFIHRAPYYERWYEGQYDLQDYLRPMMEAYGVDICFSGHMHGYERGELNGVYYCVAGGGSWLDYGEPLTVDYPHMTVGGYTDTWSAYGINGGLVNGYVEVEVTSAGWIATMQGFNSDGTVKTGVTDVFSKTFVPDYDPPTPDPATFEVAPAADSDMAISMTATTGTDISGVLYYFTETSGNPGGSDSEWQSSSSYTDTGLDPSTQYTYTVTMRDSQGNTGTASSSASATTMDPIPLGDIDAYVRAGTYGNTNYGSAILLNIKNDIDVNYDREAYLRFAYTDPGTALSSATLYLTPIGIGTDTSSMTIRVRLLDDADDGWDESTITWNNKPTGTGLETTFSGPFTVGQTVSVDVTTLVDQAMNANEVATFQLDATNAVGSQRWVDLGSRENATAAYRPSLDVVFDGTPDTDPPTPDPMTFATAPVATGATSISMTATTASDASGVEYYFTCTAGGGNDSGWQDSATYEDTGLAPSTQYTYTVTARDKSTNQNTTAASNPASATTDAAPNPPAAPSGLSATAISASQINLSWTDNATDETGFKIERSKRDNSSFEQVATVGANVTSYSDTGLKKNTTYYYRVRATNADGDSAHSNEASAKTPK
ncbi:MAG: DNRLRE domain-containing protein [Planctomycetota bacterium]